MRRAVAPAPALSSSSKKPVARPLEIRPTDFARMFNHVPFSCYVFRRNVNYLLAMMRAGHVCKPWCLLLHILFIYTKYALSENVLSSTVIFLFSFNS